MSSIILHIPHASRAIPKDVRSTLLPGDERIARELLVMTDAWTDEILAHFRPEAERVIFPVSRLVVDPERYPNDVDEPMAARGMGAIYTLNGRTTTGSRRGRTAQTDGDVLSSPSCEIGEHGRGSADAVRSLSHHRRSQLFIDALAT
jgi:N-formylglutamate amidohydrolase